MGVITKSGFFIDDVEVTSEHIGKKLKVVKSNDDRWLPVDFIATITSVSSDAIELLDTGGGDSCYTIDDDFGYWDFKWVTRPKPKKSSTKPIRQKLAKAIREAKTVLDNTIKEAEEVGMVVNISDNTVTVTFNPPVEEY